MLTKHPEFDAARQEMLRAFSKMVASGTVSDRIAYGEIFTTLSAMRQIAEMNHA